MPQALLERWGAVSQPVAEAMAQGAQRLCGSDLALSVTGVAGPDPDDRGNPVGTVFIALSTPEQTVCKRLELGQGRERVRTAAASHCLDLLRRYLTGLEI